MGQPVQESNTPVISKAGRIRLHITPFSPDLVDRIIPPSLKSEASDISFYTLQTFPERGYGYVELPAMAAEKLKNKLNGTTLKGAKVKIEEARPEKTKKRKLQDDDEEAAEAEKAARKQARRERKKQKEDGVLPGYELEDGRHVKRGWVDDPAKKSKSKRDGVDGIESKKMRFKTVVPPNKTVDGLKNGVEKKEKKEKKEKSDKERISGKKLAVVKEFDNTRKPIKSAVIVKSADQEAIYENGKGWVNGDGAVVEAETKSAKRHRERKAKEDSAAAASKTVKKHQKTQEEAEDSSSDDVDDESSVVSSSSDDSEAEGSANGSSQSSPEPTMPGENSSEPPKEIHPLEALFKRTPADTARPKPAPIDTSFNFFNSDAASVVSQDDDNIVTMAPPQTPHTKQDMEWRGLRSAAPTPDTAAFSRHSSFPFADHGDDVDEDGDEQMGEDLPRVGLTNGANGEGKEESEFRKWFYENRGDLNRGWKKRRREERKTKRQRENRKMSRRVV